MKQGAKKYFEYRILITPDVRSGSKTSCYTAMVPVLGIATDGDTVEQAFGNAKTLIEFHLES
jgi:predicted RNase H-like HicB family nuclease